MRTRPLLLRFPIEIRGPLFAGRERKNFQQLGMTRKAHHRVRLVVMLVAALSMGMHYAVVQLLGWVNITVEYSQLAPLSAALATTFDGKHSCELCKLVAKELRHSQQDNLLYEI